MTPTPSPHLEPVQLTLNLKLGFANEPIERVCFPRSGVISLMVAAKGLGEIEAAMIGFDGMTGLAIVMGDTQSPQETLVRVPGFGHCIAAPTLATLLDQRPGMRGAMLRYASVFAGQITQTALACRSATIDARLARWLLMAADRVGDLDMLLTHELLAAALGVRRPGVTDAVHRLEGELLIRSRRSHVSIRDRQGLETAANGFYGGPEREYQRIMGCLARAEGKSRSAAPHEAVPSSLKGPSSPWRC